MRFHPYSEVFPLLAADELDELADDIKAFGLREPIWLYEGQILDGRNRYLACQRAGIEPQTRTYKGTEKGALALVVSANVARRHLSPSQLSMASARIASLRAGDNQHTEGVSIETSSKMVGASVGSSKRARKVLDAGSKPLVAAVDSGEVTVSRAAAVTNLPKREQLAAAKAKPESEPAPEPDDAIPDPTEEERLVAFEREHAASLEKLLAADDKLAAAYAEIKRQAAEIASLKLARDGFQNKSAALIKQVKALQRENERLKRKAA